MSPNPPDLSTLSSWADGDSLSMVLRSHLALEVILNTVLDKAGPPGSELDRLPFIAKVDVAITLGRLSADLRPAFVIANRIRNRFAHRLDAELVEADAADFLNAFDPTSWDGMFFRAYRAALAEPPHGRVAFAYTSLFAFAGMETATLPEIAAAIERRTALRDAFDLGAGLADGSVGKAADGV